MITNIVVCLYFLLLGMTLWKLLSDRSALRQEVSLLRHPWIVGRYIPSAIGVGRATWEFQGVFATEDEARAACRDTNYFIGPAHMGVPLPHDAMQWPGLYYPLADLYHHQLQQE